MMRSLIVVVLALGTSTIARPQESPLVVSADEVGRTQLSEPIQEGLFCTAIQCPPNQRYWANAEYVFWTIGTGKLVEAGKAAYNSALFNALLDAAGKDFINVADTLLGNNRVGFRVGGGVWLDDQQTMGLEAGFLYVNRDPLVLNLGQRDLNPLEWVLGNKQVQLDPRELLSLVRQFGNQPAPVDPRHLSGPLRALLLLRHLGLPALDAANQPIIVPLGQRDLANGSATFEIAEQTLWIFDLAGRLRLFKDDGLTVDGLLGYRRVSYQDSLAISSQTLTLAPPLLPGTFIQSYDLIQTDNTYDGVLLGMDLSLQSGSWTFAIRPSATISHYRSEVMRSGATLATFADDRPRLAFAGGTYIRADELGTFTRTGWTVLPEIGLKAGRAFGDHVRLLFGTSLLYLPETARASSQLELGLDPSRTLPGSIGTFQTGSVNPPVMKSAFLSTITLGLELSF